MQVSSEAPVSASGSDGALLRENRGGSAPSHHFSQSRTRRLCMKAM
jgi:hypothetical protein